ncbi:MAG: alpha/beta hydrolase [Pseudonocardiales bacterium]
MPFGATQILRPQILRPVGMLAALALLATVGGGCTVGPSDRPAVAVRDASLPPLRPPPTLPSTPPLPPPGEYRPSSLNWQDCTDTITAALRTLHPGEPGPARVECAELPVDADLSVPAYGNSLTLDLTRIGNGPAPLVVVGEAAAEPGTVQAARLAGQLPATLLDSFTLIGLARRGTGTSEPLNCIPANTRNRILGFDPEVRQLGQLDSLLDVARTAIQTCVQDVGEVLVAINSTGAADDLETLRVRLGAPVLNVLSYGSASRAVVGFMRRYPTSVGRVVLDGTADPTLDSITGSEAALAATEAGYTAFAADCVARGCPLGSDPRAALPALAEALRQVPLQAGQQRITAGTAYQAVLDTIGTPERWRQLSEALAAARDGEGNPVAALVAPLIVPTGGLPARFDPALATYCNDTSTRVPPERAEELVEQWRARFPLFGALFAQRLLLCSAWPVPTKPSVGSGRALPPVLVVATAGDPVTPAEGARRTAESLPAATLVSWQGQAHGAVGRSPCVVELVTRFLMDGVVPPQGTLCPP